LREAGGEGIEFGWGVAAVAAKAVAAKVGGGDVGSGEVVAFGDAEGGVVAAEDVVGGVGEPAGVAELEGELEGRAGGEGGVGEEGGEPLMVGGEVGWKLDEERTEFAGDASGGDRGDELSEGCAAFAEALEVGDALGGFEAEAEAGRGGVEPAPELGCRGQCAEGVVHLNGGELGGVIVEEGAGGRVGRIEAGLPGGIGPAGGADEEISRGGREGSGGGDYGLSGARQARLDGQPQPTRRG
jgi:hypothetical protein